MSGKILILPREENLLIVAEAVGLVWKERRIYQLPKMKTNFNINGENCGVDFDKY